MRGRTWAKKRAFNQATLMVNGVAGVGPASYAGAGNASSFCTAATTASAIEAIEKNFTSVGTTELFSQSAFLMLRAFGWPQRVVVDALATPVVPNNDNGLTYEASDLDGDTITMLEHMERCDLKLHTAAEHIVTNRMESMPNWMEGDWHSFHKGVPARHR